MGGGISQEEKQASLDQYANSFFQSRQWNGFGIDVSLERFSGYNSAAELSSFRNQVEDADRLTDGLTVMEKLNSQLGGFGPVANAVGLGALVISLLIENVAKSLGKPPMGTADILRRVFAEEKGNEVRDLMDEYMKHMILYFWKPQDLTFYTKDLQFKLSLQLTRLRNSMLKDNQMTTRLLNQWVNGAAFHTQMLIHLARLERSDGAVAKIAAIGYHRDVDLLLKKYESYLIDNIAGIYYRLPGGEPIARGTHVSFLGCARPPAARQRAPPRGLAPEWGPYVPRLGKEH
ncbi:PREDICTED: uncharacterized protein LOC107082278 [Cyprinodon variegatus]|uniref:uncharacterized protein LOC107082278 n=1 Tax=Cyprinodon variegatus TaxID=28743 RepID=UPI00074292EE|nr:PREDICTED: uncharacterized protein LOC107082278 [Cyprinodon variegatus]